MLMVLALLRGASGWPAAMAQDGWTIEQTKRLRTLSLRGRRVGLHGFGGVAREIVAMMAPFRPGRVCAYSQGVPAAFIEAHGQVLWRLHDHVHIGWPDMIAQGVLQALGWQAQALPDRANIVELPAQPLRAVAAHVRARLGAATVRVAGDLDAPVRRLAFLPGACGGRRQLDLLRQPDVDAVFCGESAEWETCEYVRDAVAQGGGKGLIIAGHANSEEAGMAHVAGLVRGWIPEVPVVHLPTGDPFSYLT